MQTNEIFKKNLEAMQGSTYEKLNINLKIFKNLEIFFSYRKRFYRYQYY